MPTPRPLAVIATALTLALPAAAVAAPAPQPYRSGDAKGFRNILPPGSNGLANGPQIAAFLTTGTRPAHNDDQLAMYRDLVFAVPGLKAEDLARFYKDASFGVKPGEVERTYSPRGDVTIQRDRFGVPHVYGSTREGAMFGLGYATAEDRLFFIDVLRHLGRAQLASFAGGAQGNRDFDREQWALAPYTEADLQRQVDQGDELYGAEGAQVQLDAAQYVAGVNAYIAEAKLDPNKMPGEYAAIGRPAGPDPWKETDTVAIAALVGGIFGKGGGGELRSAQIFQEFQRRFGARAGARMWRDFRSAEDPEAPTTVTRRFRHGARPRRPRGTALPDPGSVRDEPVVVGSGGAGGRRNASPGIFGGRFGLPTSASNALVVSARESASGHPLAVFGPQTGYFAPQILMEQDVHAPTIDARGVAFPGTNLYVQLGRGRDYAWSATSAGNDNIDTFAVPLCEPGGGTPTIDSQGYLFRGQCLPFEVMERTNSWTPSAADQTPAGTETLRALRTRLGIVQARATVGGKPVAYTRLRSTYFHEVDSAGGFSDLNDPGKIKGPADFQRAMYRVGYTFNWFYVDDRHTAYFNSGNLPVRARGISPDFPVTGEKEWRGYDPDRWTATYEPFSAHPRAIDTRYFANWNNKQAPGYRADDERYNYGPLDRMMPLRDRIRRGIAGPRKMTLVQLVEAMEDAGTVDLRADKVLPWVLKVVGTPDDARAADAVAKLRAWVADGSHRRDLDRDGRYEHAEAIAILDAWWPRLVAAEFKGALGERLFGMLEGIQRLDDDPNAHGQHLGSAYDDGWYGFVQKDLRTVLGRRVRGRWSRIWCGAGSLRRCRADLVDSLRATLAAAPAGDPTLGLYRGDPACAAEGRDGDATCWDAIRFRPLGAVTQPLINWVNRPTFQQVVEVQGRAPR